MMIADLVDEKDLKQRLVLIGVPLADEQTPQECIGAAMRWRVQQSEGLQQQLDELLQALLQQADLLLPEVRSAIEAASAGPG